MTLSQLSKVVGLFLGTSLLVFSPGCSSVPVLDKLPSLSDYRAGAEEPTPTLDGRGETPDFVRQIKLPPKDPKAFGIGVVLPTGESHQAVAQSLRQGLELAVAEVNAAGGVNGQSIQLDEVEASPEALGALRDRGEAVILVGDSTLAIAQAPQLANFPQLIGFLSDYVSVPKQTPKNGVRIYLNGDQEARQMESYLGAAGIGRVSIIHTNELLGQSHQQYLLYLISANHGVATAAEAYTTSEHDFTLLAKAIFHSNNDALILAGNGFEYANILKAFDAVGWTGTVLGYAGNSGLAPLASMGGLAQGAAYPLPEFAVNPRSTEAGRTFADNYKTKYGADPDLPAAYAYDNIHVLAAAAAQAASSNPMKIRDSFIALRSYVGAAGRYDIKDDGDTEMPLRLWRAGGQPAPEPHPSAPAAAPSDYQKVPLPNFPAPAQP